MRAQNHTQEVGSKQATAELGFAAWFAQLSSSERKKYKEEHFFDFYYEILGLNSQQKSCYALEDFKRNYKALARQYHPDKNTDPSAQALFQEIAEAQEILQNKYKRQAYDEKKPKEQIDEFASFYESLDTYFKQGNVLSKISFIFYIMGKLLARLVITPLLILVLVLVIATAATVTLCINTLKAINNLTAMEKILMVAGLTAVASFLLLSNPPVMLASYLAASSRMLGTLGLSSLSTTQLVAAMSAIAATTVTLSFVAICGIMKILTPKLGVNVEQLGATFWSSNSDTLILRGLGGDAATLTEQPMPEKKSESAQFTSPTSAKLVASNDNVAPSVPQIAKLCSQRISKMACEV